MDSIAARGGIVKAGAESGENAPSFDALPVFFSLILRPICATIERRTRWGALLMQTIDFYSYQCGVIDFLNEMIHAGVKALALSRPLENPAQRDALLPFSRQSCEKYGTKLYIEDLPLLTDLFPLSLNRGKCGILFYREGHILDQYLRLKERKKALLAERAYFGGNRSQLAMEFGCLLSYPVDQIRRMIAENREKEQI